VLKHTGLLISAVLLVAIAIVAVTRKDETFQTGHITDAASKQHQSSPNIPPPTRTQGAREIETSSGSGANDHVVEDLSEESAAAFRTNAAGQLVVDEQTRLNMEALIAHAESDELSREVREQIEQLPPSAAREAEELFQKFVQYQQAQRQTYPPRDAPMTEDDAIRELEGLHALREAHFGPQAAAQLFAKEEAIAREMIELMRIENDQSLTPEEKHARAQAIRKQLPGVMTLEKRNRESTANHDRDEPK